MTEDRTTQLEIYNQFQKGQVITWEELLRIMATSYARSRDEVFSGMNQLINDGLIVLPKPDVYCTPATLAKMKKQEQDDQAWKREFPNSKTISRADFDRLDPQEKMDFATNGGRIAG